MSSTYSTSTTFTRTHARHLGSKVAADLRQCSLFYGRPDPAMVDKYQEELVELLAGGYVSEYEFGFKQAGERILCWRYLVAADGSMLSVTGDAGHLHARASVAGAIFYNFLTPSAAWNRLSATEQTRIEQGLPVTRSLGSLPGDGDGYWAETRDYGAGGVRVTRQEYRPR